MSINIQHIRTRVGEIEKPQPARKYIEIILERTELLGFVTDLLAERDASHAAGVREGLERAAEITKKHKEHRVTEFFVGDHQRGRSECFEQAAIAREIEKSIRALITPTETKTCE